MNEEKIIQEIKNIIDNLENGNKINMFTLASNVCKNLNVPLDQTVLHHKFISNYVTEHFSDMVRTTVTSGVMRGTLSNR